MHRCVLYVDIAFDNSDDDNNKNNNYYYYFCSVSIRPSPFQINQRCWVVVHGDKVTRKQYAANMRWAFISKVYSILTIQLLISYHSFLISDNRHSNIVCCISKANHSFLCLSLASLFSPLFTRLLITLSVGCFVVLSIVLEKRVKKKKLMFLLLSSYLISFPYYVLLFQNRFICLRIINQKYMINI